MRIAEIITGTGTSRGRQGDGTYPRGYDPQAIPITLPTTSLEKTPKSFWQKLFSDLDQVDETTGMRLIDLLPKKVKHMIYRYKHSDKYKAALLMMKALIKDPDVIKRGLSKQKIQDIAADYFGLDHREFAKVLNRKSRYESVEITQEDINEATDFRRGKLK